MQASFRISDWFAFKSVFSGIALSVVTPNRVGELLGRALFLPPSLRYMGAATTFVGNLAQLLITLFAGEVILISIALDWISLSGMAEWEWSWSVLAIIVLVVILLVGAIYFGSARIVYHLMQLNFLKAYREKFKTLGEVPKGLLVNVLLVSGIRYLIFLLQYAWVLYFLAGISWLEVIVSIPVFLLVLSIIPTFSIIELGLRWQLGAMLIPSAQEHLLAVTMGSFLIWFINMIVPAFVGSVIYIFFKPFTPEAKI
jgi:hypothetical protein